MPEQVQNVPVELLNRRIIENLTDDSGMGVKKAQDASTDFTRTQLREESFAYEILPTKQATDDMLDRTVLHDMPQIIWDLEPDSPGARWVPFQTVPDGEYVQGSKYIIPMARIVTPNYQKDVDELRTYRMDLRRVLTDNSIKDGLAEYDGKFISEVDSIVTDTAGGVGTAQVFTGKIQWREYSGGLTRENVIEAKKLLLAGSTFTNMAHKFRLRNHIMLMNDVTAQEFLKYDRNTAGGDLSQQLWENGLESRKLGGGMNAMFTIKANYVPDGRVYFFAAPEFFGKAFFLTDWTMYMEKKAFLINWFSYWLGGMAIGNVAGCARADFDLS